MKLYTLHGIKFYDDDKITAKPATPAEVVAAHPKCGTCRHMVANDDNDWWICDNDQSPYTTHTALHPALDYCRHHSELTKENDDDKPE